MEDDQDFNSRHRKKNSTKTRYEEIIEDDEDLEEFTESMRQGNNIQRRRRADDAEELVELPANWKDGRAARQRKSGPARRTSIAQKAPRIRPLRHSTGQPEQIDSDQSENEQENASQSADEVAESPAGADETDEADTQTAHLIQMQEENENRLAKLQAARWAEGEEEEDEDMESASEHVATPVKPVSNGPKAKSVRSGPRGRGSIRDRPGNQNVRIVGSPSKRKGPPGLRSLPKGFE
jgi:hypothetical protein